jgi:hypothetical protein
MKAFPSEPGWPDWANFRPLGGSLLWAVFLNYKRSPHFLLLFSTVKVYAVISNKIVRVWPIYSNPHLVSLIAPFHSSGLYDKKPQVLSTFVMTTQLFNRESRIPSQQKRRCLKWLCKSLHKIIQRPDYGTRLSRISPLPLRGEHWSQRVNTHFSHPSVHLKRWMCSPQGVDIGWGKGSSLKANFPLP